jgi:uncharacterized protein (DUF2141 family)
VTLSGGPYAMNPVNGTTNASGQVTFSNVPSGAGYTVQATKSGQSASQSVSVTTGATTNVTLSLPAGSLFVQVRWAGLDVNGAVVRVTGGPDSVDLTQTTPSNGDVSFANLPAGSGYTVQATKSGQSASAAVTVTGGTTTVTLNLPTGTVVVNVKRFSTNQNNATVRIKFGPMGINVTGSPVTGGNATFTNVPVGTGYTIQAWRCGASNPKTRTVTNQTVNTGTNNFALVFNTNAPPCPLT